ncbi:MAG: pitrilysin family protein [Alphaproteobacteria bacterium]
MTTALTKLPNGLTVASDRMEQVETVSVGVWVQVGTRHETAEINGVSHVLEHMAFKGTKRRSARAIAEEIEAVGGHLNAYTAREGTTYFAKVMKEDIGLALDIIADILQHSVFDPEELGREREVILQEIGQARDTPDDIVFDHFQETAYPGQPLGRPVLGTEQTVTALTREALVSHMAQHYRAGRMILAAAGKLDHDWLVERAKLLFAGLPRGEAAAPVPARYAGGEFRGDGDLEQVHLVLGFPGLPLGHPDQFAMAALSTVLGGGMSSRLFQEVREKRGLVYSIYSFHAGFADSGLFGVYAGTGEKSLGELTPIVFDQLAGVARAVAPEELARAKAQLRADVLMSLESTGARAEQIARQLTIYGRILSPAEVTAEIDKVDSAALARCAAVLMKGPLTVATLGPAKKLESYEKLSRRLSP